MEEHTSTEFSDLEDKRPQQPLNQPLHKKLNTNFYERTRSTIFMLLGVSIIFAAGQVYCSLLVLLMNILIFREINSLKRNEEK